MRTTRKQKQEQTRLAAIRAARAVFSAKGYTAATLDDIAQEMGLTKGALYANFNSKQALFLEVLRAHMSGELSDLQRIAATATGWADALPAIAKYYGPNTARTQSALLMAEFQLHAARDIGFSGEFRVLFEEHRSSLAQLLRQLDPARAASRHSAQRIVEVLMAASVGLALQEASTGLLDAKSFSKLLKQLT